MEFRHPGGGLRPVRKCVRHLPDSSDMRQASTDPTNPPCHGAMQENPRELARTLKEGDEVAATAEPNEEGRAHINAIYTELLVSRVASCPVLLTPACAGRGQHLMKAVRLSGNQG